MTTTPETLLNAILEVDGTWGINTIPDDKVNHMERITVRREVFETVNAIYNLSFVGTLDRYGLKTLIRFYIGHHCTNARLGHEPTDEDMARIWRGGPGGQEDVKTLGYWRKVAETMKRKEAKT